FFFFSSRRRHTRWPRDWSSDVCSSDLQSRFVGRALDRLLALGPTAQVLGRAVIGLEPGETQMRRILDETRQGERRFARLDPASRSEERRVGKEGGARWGAASLREYSDR